MARLMPSANVEAAYEDMFKEITRKLYGEETGNGLHTLGTPVAQVATSGPTAPEGERSFTNLIDRSVAPTIEYEHNGGSGNGASGAGTTDASASATSAGNFKPDDQLSTAFGLAALMQNGFASGGTILGAQTIQKAVNPSASNTIAGGNPSTETRWNGAIPVSVPSGGEEIVQWPTSGKLGSYNGLHKATKSTKTRDQQPSEIYASTASAVNNSTATNSGSTSSVVQHSQQHTSTTTPSSNSRKKNTTSAATVATSNQQNVQLQIPKRYACTHCPYSTDRRDLYTRHENIHKDEKPFQCYACLKQFNRADHVKKHFLRMHREMVYDINKTRRNVSSTSSAQQQSHQIDQKPNIFLQQQQQQVGAPVGVHGENFMASQRQETSSSLSIAQTIESVATASHADTMPIMKQEKVSGEDSSNTGVAKVKREKRFTCCYCPWSGADKWGLKRHLNTHTKPFVCMLCDYKAARSERLATHVLKVHNKKACNKCSFLADNQDEYQSHMNDVHLLKMDALSRNTASVAQDFHKAGGVDLKNKHQFFNNTITSKQDALLHQQRQNSKDHNLNLRSNQKRFSSSGTSSDEDDYENMKNVENFDMLSDQRKAMSAFLSRNFGLQEKVQVNIDNNNSKNVSQRNQRNEHNTLSSPKKKKKIIKQQPMKSPPAQPINLTNNNNYNKQVKENVKLNEKKHCNNSIKTSKTPVNNNSTYKGHRLDLIRDKENSNSIFSTMEYQNLSKFGTQFQNYVKDIINKYYAETPLLFPIVQSQQTQLSPPSKRQKLSETEEYIEYLKNKEDITLTITPKINNNSNKMTNNNNANIQCKSHKQTRSDFTIKQVVPAEEQPKVEVIPVTSTHNDRFTSRVSKNTEVLISESVFQTKHTPFSNMSLNSLSCYSRRSHRKQSQPKKIKTPPEVVMTHLRDKYLKKMVDRKKSCTICTRSSRKSMLVFPYHTPASLLLHRMWKHMEPSSQKCCLCSEKFKRMYSLKVHYRLMHCI